jgi:hypothetical protein
MRPIGRSKEAVIVDSSGNEIAAELGAACKVTAVYE